MNITEPHERVVPAVQNKREHFLFLHLKNEKQGRKFAPLPHRENCKKLRSRAETSPASVDAWLVFVCVEAAGSLVSVGARLASEFPEAEGYLTFTGVSPPLLSSVDIRLTSGACWRFAIASPARTDALALR